MCCGVSANGIVMKDATTPSAVTVKMNASICNKKPVNGFSMAQDFMGTLTGADTDKTAVMIKFPKDDFACLK